MNPSFTAMQKAGMSILTMMLTGREHTPKAKGTQETSINGRAFAPGHGVQQEVSSEAKEANVRAHLNKLAEETEARYAANPYDALTPAESYEVSEKPKCPTIAEIAAERHKSHQEYIDRQIALNRTTFIEPKYMLKDEEPKYPTSDLIDLLHEHIAETAARTKDEEEFEREQAEENAVHTPLIDRIAAAKVHTGDGG